MPSLSSLCADADHGLMTLPVLVHARICPVWQARLRWPSLSVHPFPLEPVSGTLTNATNGAAERAASASHWARQVCCGHTGTDNGTDCLALFNTVTAVGSATAIHSVTLPLRPQSTDRAGVCQYSVTPKYYWKTTTADQWWWHVTPLQFSSSLFALIELVVCAATASR